MSERKKVGLVLSGGGAKGAYQVGVVKALCELGVEVDVIAGASIGALNGAVLSCAGSLETGADRLEELWQRLASSSPLALKSLPTYLVYLISSGMKLSGAAAIEAVVRRGTAIARDAGLKVPAELAEVELAILSDEPLRKLMELYMDPASLQNGIPLYASVYRSAGGGADIAKVALAQLGVADTPDSEFVHVQSLPGAEQKEVLLASAALPMIFSARQVRGQTYTDGGQGGWLRSHGNTPITPLLQAGCEHVLVTHLSDGSVWDRHAFPEATVLEVRPQSRMARATGPFGGAKDLLGFDATKIPSWIDQGYQDTLHCVGRVASTFHARANLRQFELGRAQSEARGLSEDIALRDAMARLE